MHVKLLYNPAAGRGRTRRHIAEVIQCLEQRGATVEVHASRSPEDMTRLAAEASRNSCDRVVICGGDGTLNLALRHFNLQKEIGIIPLGSGDDFAHTLGIPLDVRSACETAIGAGVREVDVASANGVRYLGVAGLGFDSEVAAHANTVKFLRGSLVYLYSIFRVLPRFRPLLLSLRVDGKERAEEIMFAAVGNTHRYGAGIKIVPTAVPDDRLLDLCLVRRCNRWDLLKTLPRAYNGSHVKKPFVTLERGRHFEFVSETPLQVFADGEPISSTPLSIELLPERLRLAASPR